MLAARLYARDFLRSTRTSFPVRPFMQSVAVEELGATQRAAAATFHDVDFACALSAT